MLRLARSISSIGLVVLLSGACSLSAAASDRVIQGDRIIAGGPKNSLEVRHLVLRGTNEQIGRALAEIAKERYGVRLERVQDPVQARAQRAYLERNDPILLDRMRGVAAAFDKSLDSSSFPRDWLLLSPGLSGQVLRARRGGLGGRHA